MTMLARIKPYNKRRGHLVRILNYRGIKFDATKGWYRVDDATAAVISSIHQDQNDLESPLAFDVMTEDAARTLEKVETKKLEEKAKASDPIDAALDKTTTTASLSAEPVGDEEKPARRARRPRRGGSE
jgi:hypothetical protein